MDEFISIKLLELIKSYGLQILGGLIVIFFMKWLLILLLQIVMTIIGTVLFLLGFILKIIWFVINLSSGELRNKLDKILVFIEGRYRTLESQRKYSFGSIERIPTRYEMFQNMYVKFAKGALISGLVLIVVLLIFDILIQKRYSIEELFLYMS